MKGFKRKKRGKLYRKKSGKIPKILLNSIKSLKSRNLDVSSCHNTDFGMRNPIFRSKLSNSGVQSWTYTILNSILLYLIGFFRFFYFALYSFQSCFLLFPFIFPQETSQKPAKKLPKKSNKQNELNTYVGKMFEN